MASQKFQEMTTEDLKKREKLTKMSTGMLIACCIIMLAAGIILSVKKGFNAITIVPVSFLPLIIVNANSLQGIRKELQSRSIK